MTDNTEHTEHTDHSEHTGGDGHQQPHAPALGLTSHGWQPTPQGGEYDADATAFVQLPEGFDFSSTGTPLAAPGHDYVPPHITAPLETGTWNVHLHEDPQPYQDPQGQNPGQHGHAPQGQGQGLGQGQGQQPYGTPGYGESAHGEHDQGVPGVPGDAGVSGAAGVAGVLGVPGVPGVPGVQTHRPSAAPGWPEAGHDAGATSQWNFTEALDTTPSTTDPRPAASGQGASPDTDGVGVGTSTGQWAMPFTDDDSRDDSGEYPALGAVQPTPDTGAVPRVAGVPHAGDASLPDGAPHASAEQDVHGEHGVHSEPTAPSGQGTAPGGPVPPAPWQMHGAPATLPGGAAAPWALPAAQPTTGTATSADEPVPGDGSHPTAAGPFVGPEEPSTGTPAAGTPLPSLDSASAPDAPASAADLGAEADTSESASAHAGEDAPEARAGEADAGPASPEPGADETSASEVVASEAVASEASASEASAAPDAPTGEATASPEAPPEDPTADPEAAAAAAPDPSVGYGTEYAPDSGLAPSPEPDFAPSYAAPHEPPPFHDAPSEHPSASYVLRVNGADRPVTDAWIGESLLYVLRERLGLAGAKDGCSQGECGACAVQVDGRLVASCLVPAATTAGSEVRTVEGLATDGEPSDVQRALANCGAVQCGFCIPGMAMTVHDLLEGNHAPTELETRQALCGNLCRCSGYRGVLEAVRDVVAEREASAEAAATGPTSDEARIPHQASPGAGSAQHTLHHPHDGGMA
ncbi:hypothetical protein GCM10010329_35720 [Streptomyces spiroverticillatus]|uniref:2Fe-2S ferredoxin-type domain-containing protein n=1 Tax=Streptomyces finlayi TaxID=67296 RepID=A0A919CAG8_9ACTN|nr:2Fe-2S iron-sulfur cluster-binding protein [Streptomyces finlayi]GHA09902.1 hypothetical protein GCM10010329_35720 [Streptomyces spiroverticillatus]GHC95949.1 hypothetical protein GCM10010334_35890 [Streptomyces finlayi]